MKRFTLSVLLLTAAWSLASPLMAQRIDSTKLHGFDFAIRPEAALGVHDFARRVTSRGVTVQVALPDHWNNAETIYFPPIFNQSGGSCAAASTISYMLTHELNAYRRANGRLADNQLCSHFPWLTQHSGIAVIAGANGVPNATTYGGRTYSALLGSAGSSAEDYGWMQGYDKWYEAMHNRLAYNANMPRTVETEEGREDLKWWLYNHNGDNSFGAGGLAVVGLAATGLALAAIPSTPINDELNVQGMYYIKNWGESFDHAVTVVGYDDRIEFDLDGNGVMGEKDKDEVGAWIVANSWGSWANGGFVYVPYKNASVYGAGRQYWQPGVYHIRKDYRPLRTLKITMTYNHRAQMKLSVGVSSDLTATEPEVVVPMHHFQYCGNGDVPMLGRWADGKLHEEPMEFGYDVTDLAGEMDRRAPLKYFFIIETKDADATGAGHVNALSIMDYEYDLAGVEIPFSTVGPKGVDVKGGGTRTVIAGVVPGEHFNAPTNLRLEGNSLTWDAPQKGSGTPLKYYIYHGATLVDSTALGVTTRTLEGEPAGNYQVTTLYDFMGNRFESAKSNSALLQAVVKPSQTKRSLNLRGGGIAIPDIFSHTLNEATVELQLRPSTLDDDAQNFGTRWGEFLVTSNSNGSLTFGWNKTRGLDWEGNVGNSATTEAGLLRQSQWRHVALVVKDNIASIYVQGKYAGSVAGKGYSGLGGVDTFYIGTPEKPMQAMIDEVRIWNVARTAQQLSDWSTREIVVPTAQSGLVAYYRMDLDSIDGRPVVVDCAGGHHASIVGNYYRGVNQQWMKTQTPTAAFTVPAGTLSAGTPIALTDCSRGAITTWQWTVDGASFDGATLPSPVVTIATPGEHVLALTVTDVDGQAHTDTDTLTLNPAAQPTATFHLSADTVAMDERVSLLIDSVADGMAYEWLTPGANVEHTARVNAAVSYAESGTYNVTLRATTAGGKVTETTRPVVVSLAAPVADFEVSPAVVIKGQPTYLLDKSRRSPNELVWNLTSTNHRIRVHGGNSSLTTEKPGVYDITLTAGNTAGQNSKRQERALIVCNADAEHCLNFTRNEEMIETSNPFAGVSTGNFTIEFWAQPQTLASYNLYIGDSPETFEMSVNNNGAFTFSLGGTTTRTRSGCVIVGEWHHYAVSFLGDVAYVYRDGQMVDWARNVAASGYRPQLTGGLRIGGLRGPVNGLLDELRIWGTYFTENKLHTYANAPIADVAAARTGSDRLLLYYNFNQTSGDVADISGNNHTGRRTGFGPDGDAWSLAQGVFCLNFESSLANVTGQYLKNYQAPFSHTQRAIKSGDNTRYELTDWLISGQTTSSDGTLTTQTHVNTAKSNSMCIETGYENFPDCQNQKTWQTVTLPAGQYTFSIARNGHELIATNSVYLVAAAGETLPNIETIEGRNNTSTLASVKLSMTGTNQCSFILSEPQTVSLGLVCSLTGRTTTSIRSFTLQRDNLELHEADGLVNAITLPTAHESGSLGVTAERGGVNLTGEAGKVNIYTVDGVLVRRTSVHGHRHVALPAGLYIVAGRKVVVR